MHTFFINTSKKKLDKYNILFDIDFENKKLLTMDCPMSVWNDETNGYKSCVMRIGELIDSYVEITNEFNLIIYIDLHEYKEYSAIPKGADKERERQGYAYAMRTLYTHVIYETIVDELDKVGRKPASILIMFGSEDKDVIKGANESTTIEDEKEELISKLLGFPAADVINEMAIEVNKAYESDEDKKTAFEERLLSVCTDELVPGLRESHEYKDMIHIMCDNIMVDKNTEAALGDFCRGVKATNETETGRGEIKFVYCPYDGLSSSVNAKVSAMSELNIALHLLKCVEAETILGATDGNGNKEPIPFRTYTVEEIAPILSAKKKIFGDRKGKIEASEKLYSELRLTNKPKAFSYASFGLDEYGERIQNVDKKNLDSLKGEYKTFDETVEQVKFDGITDPEKLITQAKALRQHHLDYLKKLKRHVSEIMSNYAGKSEENKPAMLRLGSHNYGSDDEEKSVGTMKETADVSYDSMVNAYFEFCSGRSVAIKDIEEQCDWFVARVNQIKESLNRLKLVALGLLIAIIALYLPFIIIQFEAIFRNALTFITAAGSVAIPIMLLYLIFTAVSVRQKKKYKEACDKFKEKSDEALAKNKAAVDRYDELLDIVIPELRWVYEYKLDVDYYKETCAVADAKLEHHRKKLSERVEALEAILSDIEYQKKENLEIEKDMPKEIEYQYPFCVGNVNPAFYSIVDIDGLSELPVGEGGQ